jgi:hypothetical protein
MFDSVFEQIAYLSLLSQKNSLTLTIFPDLYFLIVGLYIFISPFYLIAF